MTARFLRSIQLDGFLSFPPKSEPIELTPLNVLIGPNGSGKSNLIEAFELLRATRADLAAAVREGGGASEWLWKGEPPARSTKLAVRLSARNGLPELRYRLEFGESNFRLQLIDEALERGTSPKREVGTPTFYYRFRHGEPVIQTRLKSKSAGAGPRYVERNLSVENLSPEQSVFSQLRDPDHHREITQVGDAFGRIQTFRDWVFGCGASTRKPQAADLPTDVLLPGLENLGLVLNDMQHGDAWRRLNECLRRFLPRYQQLTTRIHANHVQIYLHEEGLGSPLPASRVSDGTLRMIALITILLRPELASLLCIDEPELGLHPDAMQLIADLLIEASGRTQIIVATHSDALVSALTNHAESVVVCEYRNGTVMQRLDSERLRFWLDQYCLGELWRIGELGGNP